MRWLRMPLLALSVLTGMGLTGMVGTARGADPEIWFNPHVPLDWMNMWTDDAPWQNAAGKVQVLELVHWWIEEATDAQILAMTDFATRHHMKIGMQIQAVEVWHGDPCHTEGYSYPDQLTNEAKILKRLGVKLDIITMDEPVWFAHYDTGPGACQHTIQDLAANVATNISGLLALYPQAQLYDIESVPSMTDFPDWRQALGDFHTTLARLSGHPIRGVEIDVGSDSPAWEKGLREMQQFAHERNIQFGIISDGSGFAHTDAQWVDLGIQYLEHLEGTLGIVPDFIMFTTWLQYPQNNMPETSPSAQTWGINRYFRERTRLQAQFVGAGAKGKLTTAQGKPIAGATINGYVPGVDFSKPLPTTVVQGVVPANAAYGLMGIRLNAECGCSGINDVLVGTLQYQETQGGSLSQNYLYTTNFGTVNGVIYDGEWVGGTQVTRLITNATQPFYTNSLWFPVTPGAQFTYTIPASTIGGRGWYGNVFLLWADAAMNPTLRLIDVPKAGKWAKSSTITAADGTFQLPKLPRVGPGPSPVSVEFAGDDTYRAAGWSPLRPGP